MLTTHYMEEAEQLCDRLVIMDGGRIVAEGSPRELVAQHSTREVVELRFADARRPRHGAAAARRSSATRVEALTDRVLVYTRRRRRRSPRSSTDDGVHPESVYERRGTLEDVFLILTGRTLED